MKRILSLLLALCLTISLSACGVSQADYDAVLEENSELQAQVESLASENESLSEKYKSLLDEKTERVLSELNNGYCDAWVTTSFGDNSIYFSDGESYLQCISEKTYEISDEGIAELWADFKSSVKTLGYVTSVQPEFPQNISVKFYDPSGIYIVEFVIKIADDQSTSTTAMCNLSYADKIIPSLSNALAQ